MENEAKHEEHRSEHEHQQEEHKMSSNAKRNLAVFIAAAAIVVYLSVYFRIPMLQYYGFYEPDGYFHYSFIRAAVLNHFQLPQYMNLSGWPPAVRYAHHSPFGMYFTVLIPYMFLQVFGVSYYDIMRLVPVLFGVLDGIAAYFLVRELNRDKLLGILVMLFVALNMGNAARTSALIFRGDTFVSFYLIVALVLTARSLKSDELQEFRPSSPQKWLEALRSRKGLYAVAAGVFLSFCSLVWTGASFTIAIYIFVFIALLLFGFTFDHKKLVSDSKYLLVSLIVWFVLVWLYKNAPFYYGYTLIFNSNSTFTNIPDFLMVYIPLWVAWYAAYHFTHKRMSSVWFADTPQKRFLISVGLPTLAFLFVYLLLPSLYNNIFVGNGLASSGNFTATIQEQQVPNYNFLFASFNFQNFTTPMTLVILLSVYFSGLVVVFWLLMLLAFTPYLFMHVEEHGYGFMSGHARARFEINESMLILISYFAITGYLQMVAIRFNSLLSMPLSIFSAFTIYWLILFLKRFRLAYYASYILLILLIAYIINTDINYVAGLSPADLVNPYFIHALAWLHNNSASNSVVLTLWPDGSLVEGVANLTSVTDSVGSQDAARANPFAAWLYNSSPNPRFLLRNITGKPDYLLVRTTWMQETGGIFTESGINVSSSAYGLNPFSGLVENVSPNSQLYIFTAYGLEEDTLIKNTSAGTTLASYLRFPQGIQPFAYVGFYNEVTGDFSLIKQTAYNRTNNQTFMIIWSSVQNPHLWRNITAAYMLNTDLARSNIIKFLFQCNAQVCLWNNNAVTLRMVYVNPDTKIFRIVYNQSNATVASENYPRSHV